MFLSELHMFQLMTPFHNEREWRYGHFFIYNNCKILHSSKYKMFHPRQCLVSLSPVSKDKEMKVRKAQIGAASWLKLNSIWRGWKSWVYIKRLFHKWFALLIFFSLNSFSVPFPGACIIDSLYSQMLWDKPLQDFFPSACWGLTLGNFLRIEERESWCQIGGGGHKKKIPEQQTQWLLICYLSHPRAVKTISLCNYLRKIQSQQDSSV